MASTSNMPTVNPESPASWSESLRRMSKRNRASFLKAVVRQLDSSDALYLMELVRRKLWMDPLAELPRELQLRILLAAVAAGPLVACQVPLLNRVPCVCCEWRV
jgi:hypothetical protein